MPLFQNNILIGLAHDHEVKIKKNEAYCFAKEELITFMKFQLLILLWQTLLIKEPYCSDLEVSREYLTIFRTEKVVNWVLLVITFISGLPAVGWNTACEAHLLCSFRARIFSTQSYCSSLLKIWFRLRDVRDVCNCATSFWPVLQTITVCGASTMSKKEVRPCIWRHEFGQQGKWTIFVIL